MPPPRRASPTIPQSLGCSRTKNSWYLVFGQGCDHVLYLFFFPSHLVTLHQSARATTQNTTDWVASTMEIHSLMLFEAGKSKVRTPANIVSGENCLPRLQTTSSHGVFAQPFLRVRAQREKPHSSSPYKATHSLLLSSGPQCVTGAILHCPAALHLQTPPRCGFWASIHEFRERKKKVHADTKLEKEIQAISDLYAPLCPNAEGDHGLSNETS